MPNVVHFLTMSKKSFRSLQFETSQRDFYGHVNYYVLDIDDIEEFYNLCITGTAYYAANCAKSAFNLLVQY